ncbi:hypothetical protein T07_1225 [Trichinella nelsoni]|uniref:Secreted protein n=1 Tax=Trichinella nelsoni TaxID=6336 RepID=A0A0V0S7X9_9BILA|nr:hypothetical protein T07_1225 [Trichinella nelsoni]
MTSSVLPAKFSRLVLFFLLFHSYLYPGCWPDSASGRPDLLDRSINYRNFGSSLSMQLALAAYKVPYTISWYLNIRTAGSNEGSNMKRRCLWLIALFSSFYVNVRLHLNFAYCRMINCVFQMPGGEIKMENRPNASVETSGFRLNRFQKDFKVLFPEKN